MTTELQQLDIFAAIAQAEAEAQARAEARQTWQPGDYLRGINLGGLVKQGFYLRESQSGLVVVGDEDGNPISLLRSDTVERAIAPIQPASDTQLDETAPQLDELRVGNRVVYTGYKGRTLTGVIEEFASHFSEAVALVRISHGPLYPCGVRALKRAEEVTA